MSLDTLTQKLGTPSSSEYIGKVLIFIADETAVLASGYTELRLERRKKVADVWTEISKTTTRIQVREGVYNYFFLDPNAGETYEYEPVLMGVGQPDLRQGIYKAVDTAYEAVMSITELKEIYLFGLGDALSDDTGAPLPDRVYAHYIQAAIAKFEQKTSIRVLPKEFVEEHDYFEEDARTFMSFFFDEFPVLQVDEVALTLPGQAAVPYPTSWFKLQKDMGQLHLVPDASSPSATSVGRNAIAGKFLPNAFRLTYFAGFGPNEVPLNVKDTIGKEASMGPLNIGGDLLGGAGIASQTISLDGLSTTFNTTSSATNAGFGARLIQYTKELKDQYPEIIRYYKGLRMVIA